MTVAGTFFLEKEKIKFLFAMGEFGKKNIYLEYKDKMFDLRYLINVFKTEKIFLAIKTYYERGIFENHTKSVLDGAETKKYIFKFMDLIIEMELFDKVGNNSVITKITELEAEFDEEVSKFLIIAYTGNKIIFKDEEDIRFFYRKAKIALGYYNSDLNRIIKLVGTYVDLKKGYKVLDMSGMTSSNCFVEKKEKTLSNFIETGLFSVGNNGLIDNTVKEKLYEEIEERLEDIISEGILRELVEF
jgi:hypothetical protein